MTKKYKIFSWAYRIILALITISFVIICSIFTGVAQYDDNSDLWFLLYSVSTLTIVTVFHELDNENRYRIFIQFLASILVLSSFAFLSFLIFSVLKNGDGNLLVNSILLISTIVNGVLLFYLIQDKKYNHNG